jgi:hypothetical protein
MGLVVGQGLTALYTPEYNWKNFKNLLSKGAAVSRNVMCAKEYQKKFPTS